MNRAKKYPREPQPVFEVPAAWLVSAATVEGADIVARLGYTGADAQSIVHAFLAPGKYEAQQLMAEDRDSNITSATYRLSLVDRSTYTWDVVSPGGLNVFVDHGAAISAYSTSIASVAVEFMIVYMLAHNNVKDILNTVCNKLLQHFDTNADGTYKDLIARRTQLSAFYNSEAYIKEVDIAARVELRRRLNVLLQSLCPLLVPTAKGHLGDTKTLMPWQSVTATAAFHALDVACARLQERRDESGIWYHEQSRTEAAGWRFPLTDHARSIREDYESPVGKAAGWFDEAFRSALDLIAFGIKQA